MKLKKLGIAIARQTDNELALYTTNFIKILDLVRTRGWELVSQEHRPSKGKGGEYIDEDFLIFKK